VRTETTSRWAISRLDSPLAARVTISCSRWVRGSGAVRATEHDDGRLVQPDLERLDAGVDPPQGLLNSLQTPESSARRCETPPSR
jgi:hypothetical protein